MADIGISLLVIVILANFSLEFNSEYSANV